MSERAHTRAHTHTRSPMRQYAVSRFPALAVVLISAAESHAPQRCSPPTLPSVRRVIRNPCACARICNPNPRVATCTHCTLCIHHLHPPSHQPVAYGYVPLHAVHRSDALTDVHFSNSKSVSNPTHMFALVLRAVLRAFCMRVDTFVVQIAHPIPVASPIARVRVVVVVVSVSCRLCSV